MQVYNPLINRRLSMAKKPGFQDAELILKLYDLRREPEMRKARNWWAADFWPESADDFMKTAMAVGTQENNWLRQVGGYWDLAASLVVHGTLNEALFLEPSFCNEMFLMYAKIQPFLKELRVKMQNPHMLANIEKVVNHSRSGRERLKFMQDRMVARRKMLKQAAAAK
jgi:hypothetical protein